MLTFGLIALFTVAAVAAVVTMGWQITRTLPQIAELKKALAECPQTRELRFTVLETLVSPRYGQVVALPIKLKASGSPQPLRAAA